MKIDEIVCTAQVFVCFMVSLETGCGKSNRFQHGGCHESKLQLD